MNDTIRQEQETTDPVAEAAGRGDRIHVSDPTMAG